MNPHSAQLFLYIAIICLCKALLTDIFKNVVSFIALNVIVGTLMILIYMNETFARKYFSSIYLLCLLSQYEYMNVNTLI